MHTLPSEYITILSSFACLFSKRIWPQAQLLLIGAILAPGQRTVAAILRIIGLETNPHFQTFHRVLNRARWSSSGSQRSAAGLAGEGLCACRSHHFGLGRHDRAPQRSEDPGERHLPRPCALQSKSLRQSQWVEVVEPDAVDTDTMGQAGLGLALPDSPGTFGAVL